MGVNAFQDALMQRLSTIDQMGADATTALRQRLMMQQAASVQPYTPTAGTSSGGSNGSAVYHGNGKDTFDNFMRAISAQESGGRYNAIGVPVRGDRAYGKYQIMGNNIPSWTRAALGRSVSVQQFLNSPQIQEKVARYHLSNYYNRYGAGGAAVAWYAGEGNARKYVRNGGRGFGGRQTGGPSISAYAISILRRMGLA